MQPETKERIVTKVSSKLEYAAARFIRIFTGSRWMDMTPGHRVGVVESADIGDGSRPNTHRVRMETGTAGTMCRSNVLVDSLQSGMRLLTLAGLLLTVDSVAVVANAAPTYDLHASNSLGYFVGEDAVFSLSGGCHLLLQKAGLDGEQITRVGNVLSENLQAVFARELSQGSDQLHQFFKQASGEVFERRVRAWEVLFSDALVRRNPSYLQKISDAINPATHNYNAQALKQAYDNTPDKVRFVELLNPAYQVPFGGNRILVTDMNIIQQSSATITQIRNANGIGGSRNIGFIEGQVNGQTINPLDAGNFRISNDALNSAPLFEPSFVARHVRDVDSEFKLLDDLAKSLGATSPNGVYPQVSGTVRLVSERAFCASCSRIITEFSDMFPNVNLSLVNGVQ